MTILESNIASEWNITFEMSTDMGFVKTTPDTFVGVGQALTGVVIPSPSHNYVSNQLAIAI